MSDRKEALDKLTALTQELGLYDDDEALVTAVRERDEARAEVERLKEQVKFYKTAKVAQTDRVEQTERERDAEYDVKLGTARHEAALAKSERDQAQQEKRIAEQARTLALFARDKALEMRDAYRVSQDKAAAKREEAHRVAIGLAYDILKNPKAPTTLILRAGEVIKQLEGEQ